MMHYQHPTPKRSLVLSNGPWIQGLDLGKLPKSTREMKTEFKTTRENPSTFLTENIQDLQTVILIPPVGKFTEVKQLPKMVRNNSLEIKMLCGRPSLILSLTSLSTQKRPQQVFLLY